MDKMGSKDNHICKSLEFLALKCSEYNLFCYSVSFGAF